MSWTDLVFLGAGFLMGRISHLFMFHARRRSDAVPMTSERRAMLIRK